MQVRPEHAAEEAVFSMWGCGLGLPLRRGVMWGLQSVLQENHPRCVFWRSLHICIADQQLMFSSDTFKCWQVLYLEYLYLWLLYALFTLRVPRAEVRKAAELSTLTVEGKNYFHKVHNLLKTTVTDVNRLTNMFLLTTSWKLRKCTSSLSNNIYLTIKLSHFIDVRLSKWANN